MIGEGSGLDQIKKLLLLLKENLSNTSQGLKEVPPNILDEVNKCPTDEELEGYLFNALSLHKEICLEAHLHICEKCRLEAQKIRSMLKTVFKNAFTQFFQRPQVEEIFSEIFRDLAKSGS